MWFVGKGRYFELKTQEEKQNERERKSREKKTSAATGKIGASTQEKRTRGIPSARL
jgi:hypothetical protein